MHLFGFNIEENCLNFKNIIGHNFLSSATLAFREPRKKHVLSGVITGCLLEIKDGIKYVVTGDNMKMYPEYV